MFCAGWCTGWETPPENSSVVHMCAADTLVRAACSTPKPARTRVSAQHVQGSECKRVGCRAAFHLASCQRMAFSFLASFVSGREKFIFDDSFAPAAFFSFTR